MIEQGFHIERHYKQQSLLSMMTSSSLLISILFACSCWFTVNAKPTEKTLKMVKLADGVYQHISYEYVSSWGYVGSSGLVVVDGKNAHIIDTAWTESQNQELLSWVTTMNLTVKSVIVTHFHEDSSAGIPFFNDLNINTYASTLTNMLLTEAKKESATMQIADNPQSMFNGLIEVFYPGPGHSQDNIVVWLPEAKLLFGGCFIRSNKHNHLGNVADASIEKWAKSVTQVINRYPEVNIVVPGHGKIGGQSMLSHTKALAISSSSQVN